MSEERLWIRVAIGALLGAAFFAAAWLLLVRQPDGRSLPQPTLALSTATPVASVDKAGELTRRMEEIAGWRPADRRFVTDTQEPLVLLHKERQVVYVQNNQIRYDWLDGMNYQNIPLSFPSARSGFVWRSGTTAYVGLPAKTGEPGSSGDWYAINLAQEVGNPLKRLGRLPIAPERVKAVSFAGEPEGALFLVADGDDTFQEYWVSAESKGPLYVSDSSYDVQRVSALAAERAAGAKLAFDSVRRLEAGMEPLYALQDARGLVIYEELPTGPAVYRFSGYALETVKPVSANAALNGLSGSMSYLLNVTAGEQRHTVLLHNGGPVWLEDDKRLEEPGWALFDDWNFVRLSADRVETIAIDPSRHAGEGAGPTLLHPRYESLLLQGAAEVVRSQSLLSAAFAGERRYLSLYDLMNRTGGDKDALWMKELPEGRSAAGGSEGAAAKELSVPFPAAAADAEGAPEPLQRALDAKDRAGSSETASHTIRRLDGRWYVLTGSRLEQWDNDRGLVPVAELPVSVSCTSGSYRVCTSALDFTRAGADWYVADTFAGRVVKADGEGRLLAEAAVQLPSALSWNAAGELLADGLGGRVRLSRELIVLGGPALAPAADATGMGVRELPVYPDSYYDDGHGRHWAFRTDRLLVWDEKQRTLRSVYTGQPAFSGVRVKLVPYGQRMLLVYDDRVLFFDAGGQFLKQVTLPALDGGEAGALPVAHSDGSFALDAESGELFVLQGSQVLRVDLDKGDVSTLFAQTRVSFGKLLLSSGTLYVTMQAAGGYASLDSVSELLRIDSVTGRLQRFRIPSGYQTESLAPGGELALGSPQMSAGGAPGTRLLVPLKDLQ